MKQRLILLLLLCLTACGTTGIQSRLDEIDGYVDSDPQAALAALTGLDMGDVRSRSDKAHYSLLYSKALDKCYIDTTDVSVVADAVDWYSRHGSPDEKMQTYYYLGRIYGNAGRYTESIIALTQALEEGEQSSDVKYKGRVYIAMADAYNNNYNVIEEGRCVDKALEYFKESGDSTQIRAALFRKAISCMNLDDYDESDSLFCYLLSIPDLKPHLRANCLYHYAYLLALRDGDPQRAKALFEEAAGAGAGFTQEAVAAYSYILWCTGDKKGSDEMFGALEQSDSTAVGLISFWKSRIKAEEGSYHEAYNYLDNALTYSAKAESEALRQSLSIAQRDYYSAVAEQQRVNADNHKTVSVLIGVASIAVVFLLFGIGINVIRRIKERSDQAISNLEYIRERMMAAQKSADDKEIKIQSLQAKFREVFREHLQIVANLYESYDLNLRRGADGVSTYKQVQDVFKAIRGEEESGHLFEQIIDRDMDGLISAFRRDFPKLKELDYQLFCYYVAGYDTKTISIILSERSADSLYMRKSRLKKKIEDSSAKDKEKYLEYFRCKDS